MSLNQTIRGGDLARYRAFLAVAARNNFRRAAADLGTSAPALSQSIRALEEKLGVQLFRRTTRSVAITERGAELQAKLRPLLAELDSVLEGMREQRTHGTVRLNVPQVAAAGIVADWLAPFTRLHPDVVLDVTVDDRLTDIVAEHFDAGIRLGERLARDMVAVPIEGKASLAAVASAGYFKAFGTPETPRELEQHRCISQRLPTHGQIYHWEFERRGRAFEVSVNGPLIVTDTELAIRAALSGVGIAYVLESTVSAHLRAGRLVRVLEEWSPSFAGMHLYYPRHRYASPALKTFLDFVRADLRSRRSGDRRLLDSSSTI
jgi:DNA-binding transcriptional LysR family regulator